jgi:hypothetical protein
LTLVRSLGRSRDRAAEAFDGLASPDMAAGLKRLRRLRRENEILCQKRDILKRVTASSAREGSW